MKTHASCCLINHELVAILSLVVVYKHSFPSRVPFRGIYLPRREVCLALFTHTEVVPSLPACYVYNLDPFFPPSLYPTLSLIISKRLEALAIFCKNG